MRRSALVAGSILLLGCGTPFQLLIHNQLPSDAEFTVRWKEDERARDNSVLVPAARAEDVSLSFGSPPKKIDIEWREADGHPGKITNLSVPERTYHAYVDGKTVRFEPKDWMDNLNDNFLWLTPVWWGCGLFVVPPVVLVAYFRRRKATAGPEES